MRRIAAHYIWCKQVYNMHYVELCDDGTLSGIYPLSEEIANTSFYNGVVVVMPEGELPEIATVLSGWRQLTDNVESGDAVMVCHLGNLSASTAKFGTDDSGGNGYVERL